MKSLLRWIGRALLAIVLLLVAVLAVFRVLSLTRERKTAARLPHGRGGCAAIRLVVMDSTNRLGDWLEVVSAPDDSLSSQLANLSKLTMPTLLIWGDRDTITPLWQGEKLQKTIRHSSLLVLKGLGHIPQIEDSSEFNAALLPFLTSVRQMIPGS